MKLNMTAQIINAILRNETEIELSGNDLQEAIALIRSKCGFIPTMERRTTNAGWKLKIH